MLRAIREKNVPAWGNAFFCTKEELGAKNGDLLQQEMRMQVQLKITVYAPVTKGNYFNDSLKCSTTTDASGHKYKGSQRNPARFRGFSVIPIAIGTVCSVICSLDWRGRRKFRLVVGGLSSIWREACLCLLLITTGIHAFHKMQLPNWLRPMFRSVWVCSSGLLTR